MPRSSDKEKVREAPLWTEGSDNIFKDLGFPDDEAVNLLARADLMIELHKIISLKGWSQREAAKHLDVAQPRVAEIMKMRTECFSVDLLLKYLDKLGYRVNFVVESRDDVA